MKRAFNLTELRRHSRSGVITMATLERLGVSPQTAYRRCKPGELWQRPLPGVFILGNAPPSPRQLIEAALLFAGPEALLTGVAACRCHGLRSASDETTVHVLIPHDRNVKSCDYVIVERTTRFPERVLRDGVPLAPLPRAVLDACRRFRAFDPCRALLAEAVQRGRVTAGALEHELAHGSQRGTAVPRSVLRDVLRGARSVAEIDGMRVWKHTGLPHLSWNVDLFDEGGRLIARPDGWCDEVGLAWEIDSYEYHFGREGYARTLERNARYAAAGILVVQTLPNRLRTEPDVVAAELRAAYRAAADRPRPNVRPAA
ncbi:hypothetical protein [Actinophytocola algeriensis]|uniref:Uncharacterized protein n=1 Tax=Actinophytocola algeriensis TaxID=1768010 RepID=A0A7W7VCD8_9PSEU|nr:hypothetical protein [Actinophytocola algeriensis]MBB4904935.1 hypothetical protein [Actinophytocola algeriensis]MBE1476205.1 hypothetical protein [Actinophytocola algeriensis]